MLNPRNARGQVLRPFTVVADGLVAVEIQSVREVTLYVEDRDRRSVLDPQAAQFEVNRPRGLRDIQDQAVRGGRLANDISVARRESGKAQQKHQSQDEWKQGDKR